MKPVLLETERIGEITPEIVERALTDANEARRARERKLLQRLSNRSGRDRRALRRARRFVFGRCDPDDGRCSGASGECRFPQRRRPEMDAGAFGRRNLVREEEPARLLRPAIIGGWNVVSPNFIAQREVDFETAAGSSSRARIRTACWPGCGRRLSLLLEAGPERDLRSRFAC